MKIGILGTGQVGNLIGSRLIENGHQVMMGGRESKKTFMLHEISEAHRCMESNKAGGKIVVVI